MREVIMLIFLLGCATTGTSLPLEASLQEFVEELGECDETGYGYWYPPPDVDLVRVTFHLDGGKDGQMWGAAGWLGTDEAGRVLTTCPVGWDVTVNYAIRVD